MQYEEPRLTAKFLTNKLKRFREKIIPRTVMHRHLFLWFGKRHERIASNTGLALGAFSAQP